jgi:AraC family transcriptional regulator
MSVVKQALWIIERHLDRNLTLPEVASGCGVTPPHLSQAFAHALGQPMTSYIRARRMSRAAERLAEGASDILQVALDAGYGSHEAFTRAFKRQFERTPEAVRSSGSVAGLTLTSPKDMIEDLQPGARLYGRERRPEMLAVGLAAHFRADQMHEIPSLWRRFGAILPEIEHHKGNAPVGLCGPFGPEGDFDYACAIEVRDDVRVPSNCALIRIPSTEYAIFRHQGHVSTIAGTYRRILDNALPEHGWTMPHQPTLECHDQGFDVHTGHGGVTIWVPIMLISADG